MICLGCGYGVISGYLALVVCLVAWCWWVGADGCVWGVGRQLVCFGLFCWWGVLYLVTMDFSFHWLGFVFVCVWRFDLLIC